jgi:hypothetical protein
MLSSKGHPGIFAHQPGAQHLNETEAIGDYTPGLPGAWHLSSQEHSLPEMDKFSMSLSNMQDPHFEAGKGAPLYEKRALSPDMDLVRARSPQTRDDRASPKRFSSTNVLEITLKNLGKILVGRLLYINEEIIKETRRNDKTIEECPFLHPSLKVISFTPEKRNIN